MLYWKSWLETRRRFIIDIMVMTIPTYLEYLASFGSSPRISYLEWTRISLIFHTVFLYCVLYLGLGGLHRERRRGTSSFTLALPVKRREHFVARAAVGFIETVVLALIPILIATGFFLRSTHHSFLISLAVRIAAIWIATGVAAFALSLVLSNAVTSTIPYTLLLLFAWTRPIRLLTKIDASSGLDFGTLFNYGLELTRGRVVVLPFPTSTVIFILIVAGFLTGIAIKIEQRQEI